MTEKDLTRADGVTDRLIAVMHECKEHGLQFRVLLGLAEKRFQEESVPEKPEQILRDILAGPLIRSGLWGNRIRRCLDGLPPQLNLVDRGAKDEAS